MTEKVIAQVRILKVIDKKKQDFDIVRLGISRIERRAGFVNLFADDTCISIPAAIINGKISEDDIALQNLRHDPN